MGAVKTRRRGADGKLVEIKTSGYLQSWATKLLDSGAIAQAEFDAIKAKALA